MSFGKLGVTISPDPLTIVIYESQRLVQRLVIDSQKGNISFDISDGPVLGRRGDDLVIGGEIE